ncbi:MAG: hypothetical protein ACTHN3_11675 [Solirubrobacterales bacterium]
MQSRGGAIAFYEIAATLIPLLLLGGVALELARPLKTEPTRGNGSSGKDEQSLESYLPGGTGWQDWWRGHRAYLMRRLVPAFGILAILIETFALHAVATGSVDRWHALFVWGGLLFGMLVAVIGVWVPWLSQRFNAPLGRVALISGALMLASLYFISGLLQAPIISVFNAVSTPPRAEKQLPPRLREAVWLAHLVSTSDFRIVKLERAAAKAGVPQEQLIHHLATQVVIHDRQCKALDRFIGHDGAADFVGPWTCP